MRRTAGLTLIAVLFLSVLMAFGSQPARAQSSSSCSAGGYYVASLNADIDPGASDFMSISVSNAEAACATHIVFVLQTNGGDGGDMESMVSSIEGYQQWGGNFTTLVAPTGAFAFSAGSYIAEASTDIYMAPGTTIGSATPIVSGIPTGEVNSTMTKDINAFATYMASVTVANGRNGTAAAIMVTGGVSYTESEAVQLHVVNGLVNATTLSGALADLGVPSNTPVNTPGVGPTLISIFSNPNVASLLFLVGIAAVLVDIYHPTIVLSAVGIAVIAVSLFGLGVFGASPLAILLMIAGAAFMFLEVKTQHGISATIGVVIFIIGFLLVYQLPTASSNPSLPAATFTGIPDITYALLVGLGVAIVIGSLYLRTIRNALVGRPKTFDQSRLIGKEGKMESDLKSGGRGVALVGSEEWSVTSEQDLKRGDPIKVKEVQGLALKVEKLPQ